MFNSRVLIFFFLLSNLLGYGQDTTFQLLQGPDRYIDKVSSRATILNQKLDSEAEKILGQLQKWELRLKRKLSRKDSLKAETIFGNIDAKYKQLEQRLTRHTSLQHYVAPLDSMNMSLKFLQENPLFVSSSKSTTEKLKKAIANVEGLETGLQKTEEVKRFLKERKQYLKDQLRQLGFAKDLKKINKQIYYYNQKANELKSTLQDHKKLERKALELLSNSKQFKEFIGKNGFLAKLFPTPSDNAANTEPQSGFAGLQTRLQINSFVQQASMSGSTTSSMQQSIQEAQSGVNQVRDQLARLGITGGDQSEIPDFKINNQRAKSFFKRLEFGTNFQSEQKRGVFPAASDIGVSVGYKLSDKNTVGVGISYKISIGTGWNDIKISHQGLGLRTYVDWKIKGSFWISGGYERNYRAQFKRVEELKEFSAWQQSGLVGLSKIVSFNTKFFRKAKLQLLWDMLSYKEVPATKPLLFRIGYNF